MITSPLDGTANESILHYKVRQYQMLKLLGSIIYTPYPWSCLTWISHALSVHVLFQPIGIAQQSFQFMTKSWADWDNYIIHLYLLPTLEILVGLINWSEISINVMYGATSIDQWWKVRYINYSVNLMHSVSYTWLIWSITIASFKHSPQSRREAIGLPKETNPHKVWL